VTFSKSLMVFIGMSKLRKTNPIFVDARVKVNGTYCHAHSDDLAATVMCEISGEFFTFH